MQSCFFRCWLISWAIAVFLPSALIASFALAPHGPAVTSITTLPAATWGVADEMGPAAKLLLGACIFAAFLLVERSRPARQFTRIALAVIGALIAMLVTIALLPADWSHGFATGLGGNRFDPSLLATYLTGAAAAGLTFAMSVSRCLTRLSG